jgi:hypothetical protein
MMLPEGEWKREKEGGDEKEESGRGDLASMT